MFESQLLLCGEKDVKLMSGEVIYAPVEFCLCEILSL